MRRRTLIRTALARLAELDDSAPEELGAVDEPPRDAPAADAADTEAADAAFALLHHIVGVRLRRGLRTVVDATNVQSGARKELVALARAHDVLPVAIVLGVPDSVCVERNSRRPGGPGSAGAARGGRGPR